MIRDTKFDKTEATQKFSNTRPVKFHKTFSHSRMCRHSVIHWATPVPHTSTRGAERKTRSQSHAHLNETLFWKVTPQEAEVVFCQPLAGPGSPQGAKAPAPAGSPAAQWGGSPNNRWAPRTPLLSNNWHRTAVQFLLHVFLLVPALQGSSPLYRGEIG